MHLSARQRVGVGIAETVGGNQVKGTVKPFFRPPMVFLAKLNGGRTVTHVDTDMVLAQGVPADSVLYIQGRQVQADYGF
jgi:hypothetical protein